MNLTPLAQRLHSKKIGIIGKTLFVNMLPINTAIGILLRNDLRGTEIDYELRGYTRTQFQAIVRAPNYPQGESLMEKLTQSLTVTNTPIGDIHFNFIRPRTEPVVFPLSEGNLLEFSVYFDVSGYKLK